MLRSIRELVGYTVEAVDGEVGQVHDFYFDDTTWTVRYLVAETGTWLAHRRVLLSTVALGEADWEGHVFSVLLKREQVEGSPHIGTRKPVSRQMEEELFSHYLWSPYWRTAGVVSGTGAPMLAQTIGARSGEQRGDEQPADPHLRSTREVAGYGIQATDGEIGRVDDFIVDDESWEMRYLVVDTGNWLSGRKVLVAPSWIDSVVWAEKKVRVGLTRATIEHSPVFDPSVPVNAEYEVRLYDYYGRPRPLK